MARTLPAGLSNLLQSRYAETHSWLILTTPGTNDPSLTYHLATASITIDGVPYQPALRDTGAVKMSLTRAADRVDVQIENASEVFGPEFLRDRDKITGATVTFGRYWRDLDNAGNAYSKSLLRGAVAGVRVTTDAIQLTLVSDLYSTGSIGANRLVARRCQWTFREAGTCNYSGVEMTCNKRHTDADGCSGRTNTFRFGGFIYIDPAAAVTTAVSISGPPANQLVKSTAGTSYLQRQFIAFDSTDFAVSDNGGSEQTEISLSGSASGLGWYNVKAYGAVGDGATDDTADVQAAIDAAAAAGGGVVYFPPGTYDVDTLDLSTAIGVIIQGSGIGVSILECRTANTPILMVTGQNAHDITIRDIEFNGGGPSSGASGHGLYFHTNNFDTYNLHLDNVRVLDCGGHGILIDGQFTNNFNKVFISNCGSNAFDISGGNTVMLSNCYADDIADGKVGYRVHAGQLTMLNCNGLDSLGSTSDWAVIGDTTADDGQDRYCDAVLIGCNVEAFKRYGVYAKTGSRASFQGCFFTTSASGSSHIAIKTGFTNNESGTVDAQCRFNVQGTGTWADGYPIHGTDRPVLYLGRRTADETFTKYWNDSGGVASRAASASVEFFLSQPLNVKADYGAIGDGTTDDTSAVQAAIDDTEAAGGGTVYFPPGTYLVTGLTVVGRVRLVGAGEGASIIYSTSNAVIVDMSEDGSFRGGEMHSLTVRGDVTAGTSQIGVKLDAASYGYRFLIRDVRIESCGDHGLVIYKAFSSRFENIFITDCADYPFLYDAANMPGNVFHSLYVGDVRAGANVAFRIKAGEFIGVNCNGINGGGGISGSTWIRVGKKNGVDGDATNSGAVVRLIDSNLESWDAYGIYAYHASIIDVRGRSSIVGNATAGQIGYYHEHINDGTDYYAQFITRGIWDDTVNFADGVAAYANSEPIHCNGFLPIMINGLGPGTGGGAQLTTYRNTTDASSQKLARADGRHKKTVITSTTSIPNPGGGYYEVDSTGGAITLTLEWSGWHDRGQAPVFIKDVGGAASTNNITIDGGGGGTTEGSTYVMDQDGQGVILMPDGDTGVGDWRVIAHYAPSAGTGDVTGPGSSTDNTIARFHLTTGKIIQGSGVAIDDSDNGQTSGNWQAAIFRASGGAVTSPAFSSSGDTNTGLNFPGADEIELATNGTQRVWVTNGNASFYVNIRADKQIVGISSAAPSIAAGTGAGTGPTIAVTDTTIACFVDLTTGTAPATSAKVFDLTFSENAPNYYQAWIQPANANAAALSGAAQVFVDDASAANNKVTVFTGSTGLAATTQYLWYVFIVAV